MPKKPDSRFIQWVKGLASSLPLPSRGYTSGRYVNWAAGLNTFGQAYQPIDPSEAKNGVDNAIVGICINWIATSWFVAVPQVGMEIPDGEFQPTATPHPLVGLLADGAEDMDGRAMQTALITDFVRWGNAFCHILRGGAGRVVGLEYIPARWVKPIPDPKTGRLSHYQYTPYAEIIEIPRADIVHIRHGVDESYTLLGISPLAACYREIVTDNSYSDYAAGLARNGGIPPIVFTPRATSDPLGGTVAMDGATAQTLSDKLNEKFRAEPGRTRVLPGALEMHKTGVSPNEMALTDVRAMPETRIPAALGLNALGLQLYTGVQKATFNNLAAAMAQAWRGCVIPMQEIFADAFTRQLLKQMKGYQPGMCLRWDTSHVLEIQPDMTAVRTAAREDVKAGIITADEARQEQGKNALTAAQRVEVAPEPAQTEPTDGPTTPTKAAFKMSGSPKLDIFSVAELYRRRLEANEQAALDEMAALWLSTQADVQKEIDAVLARLESEESGAAINALLALEERMGEIRGYLSDLADRGAAVVESGQRTIIATTVDGLPRLASAAAGPAPAGVSLSWNKVPADAYEALVGFSSDGSPLADLLSDAGADYMAALRQALLTGIATGKGASEVARTMSGITGETRARMENIARTEMNRASREAARRTYAENGDVLNGYIRLATNSTRTCAACWALSGTKHTTAEIMPSHPQCRCVMVPDTKSFAELTGDDSIPDERPRIPSGPDLFATLPEADQLEILGPGRFEQYRAGAPLSAFVHAELNSRWGPSVTVAPLAESAARMPVGAT